MKLLKHRVITGKILLKTGLHIGGGGETIQIGGMDNPIIKSPLNDYPYIPGSSLKGKMRSLLEWKYDKSPDGNPCKCSQCDICRIFGTSGAEESTLGPTRIIIRDAHVTQRSREDLNRMRQEKGLIYAEEKYENSIDRLKGTAKNPRPTERVPAGIDFDFEIVLRVFEGDNEQEMMNKVREALRLVQADALGGSGSRGYGKVEFISCKDESGVEFTL
ncbi:MAG TPA: type III-A CRISPR-associated RAMP protein Csm3 [Methylomirabilota bacterium]|nr:type III-A CRISPR-associated RAMP protein Csm3 [Methylomirabilota bacterium]